MKCRRCGADAVRLTPDQRYCPQCVRDLDALLTPRPAPAFTPEWRRTAKAKDLTGAAA